MPINTLNEKLSLIEYGNIFQPALPVSNNGIGLGDKWQLLWEYSGFFEEAIYRPIYRPRRR